MSKKTLATLGLAAGMMLSGAPNAMANINSNNDRTGKELIENFRQDNTEIQGETISFEDAQKLQDTVSIEKIRNLLKDHDVLEELMNTENVQKFLEENNISKEDAISIINDILSDDDKMNEIGEIIENNEVIQEAINRSDVEKLQQKLKEAELGERILFFIVVILSALANINARLGRKNKDTKKDETNG